MAKTGVVGILKVGDCGKTIGLRVDMDALPIQENNGKAWISKIDGCDHDGHTASLLAAAHRLAQMRRLTVRCG